MKIAGPAFRLSTEEIVSLPAPHRHSDLRLQVEEREEKGENIKIIEHGFITDTGEYLDRYEALKVAIKAQQILPGRVLYMALLTEDMW